jgi:hypothetical protein
MGTAQARFINWLFWICSATYIAVFMTVTFGCHPSVAQPYPPSDIVDQKLLTLSQLTTELASPPATVSRMHLQAAELLCRRHSQRHHRYHDSRHTNSDAVETASATL